MRRFLGKTWIFWIFLLGLPAAELAYQRLEPEGSCQGYWFGLSLCLDAHCLCVGAPNDQTGFVYMYTLESDG